MFKRAKVVMLPTKEKAKIGYLTSKGEEFKDLRMFDREMPVILDSKNFHLYITSDDEIKKKDWYIHKQTNNLRVVKCVGNNIPMDAKKIIATTDSSLLVEDKITELLKGTKCLPQPSQSFIEKYVEEYNKGNIIIDVLVEMNSPCCKCDTQEKELNCPHSLGDIEGTCTAPNPNNDFYGLNVKVNPKDNTITIKKVKDSWSRKEVEELIYSAMKNRCYTTIAEWRKWIEENL